MTTATKRPGSKIIALSIAAILIVGSAVYLKYFSPEAKENNSTLGYQNGSIQAGKLNLVAQALQDQFLKPPTTDTAFTNPNFEAGDNFTDRFSKATFASYMSLQNAGSGDGMAQQGVIESMVTKAALVENPDKYALSDIKTFDSKNKAELVAYANAFATIEQKHFIEVKNNIKKYKTDLEAFADVYIQIAAELALLPAPLEIASLHLRAVNIYANLGQDYKNMLRYDEDPLKALLAIKQAKEIENSQAEEYKQWKKFWDANGILFSKEDPAYKDWGQVATPSPSL